MPTTVRPGLRRTAAGLAPVLVAAVSIGLVMLGIGWLGYVVGGLGAVGLGVLAQNTLRVQKAAAWTVALVFGLALVFPGGWLGGDLVLQSRGVLRAGSVLSFQQTEGVHSSKSYAVVRLGSQLVPPGGTLSEVTIDDTAGLGIGSPVEVLVDPAGQVPAILTADLHTERDAVLTGLGLLLAVGSCVWWTRPSSDGFLAGDNGMR
jgi:hypothetical protein